MCATAITCCFESAVAITLHFQLCSARYTALQMKNSRRTASVINLVTTKIRHFHMPQLSVTDSKVKWSLHFTFSFFQPVTQHYKQRTVLESPLQSIQSSWKIQTIPVYKCAVGKPCITLSIPLAVSKKNGTQRRTKVSP